MSGEDVVAAVREVRDYAAPGDLGSLADALVLAGLPVEAARRAIDRARARDLFINFAVRRGDEE